MAKLPIPEGKPPINLEQKVANLRTLRDMNPGDSNIANKLKQAEVELVEGKPPIPEVTPPATIAPKASEMPIKGVETPQMGVTTPEAKPTMAETPQLAKQGIGKPPIEPPPAPPVGPALGQHGLNIGEFCSKFNEATKNQQGNVIPVEITVYEDRTYDFKLKTPLASDLLKKAAGIERVRASPIRKKLAK